MSHLTTSADALWTDVVTGLAGEGFTFAPLTETRTQFLARALGDAEAYLTKPFAQLLAELNSHFGGSTVSHLTMGFAELLFTLGETLDAGGEGEVWPPTDAIIAADFVNGRYYADGGDRTQAQFMTLNQGTLGAGGLHTTVNEEPPSGGPAVLASLNANLAGGVTIVWDGVTDADFWRSLLGLYPELDPGASSFAIEIQNAVGTNRPRLDDWNELAVVSTENDYLSAARNKVAVTLSRNVGGGVYRSAASLNGSSIVDTFSSQDLSYGLDTHLVAIQYAAICGTAIAAAAGGSDGTFTRFTVYPAVDETQLPILSALS